MAINDAKLTPQEQAALGVDAFNNPIEQPQQEPVPLDRRTPEQVAADQEIEKMLRSASDVTTVPPMALAPEPVQVPFASAQDFRDFEMEQAQERQAIADQQFQELEAQRQLEAQQNLAQQAAEQRAIASQAAQQELRQAQVDKQVSENLAEREEDGRKTLSEIFQGGSLGQKIGAAISILAGGVAQGLLKTTENPVLSFMEKVDQQLLADRKLKATALNDARKAALDKLELELKKKKAQTDDQKTQLEMDKIIAETQKIKADINEKRKVNENARLGVKITDINSLSPDQRKSVVRAPDGSFRLALNEKAAEDVRKFMADTGPVVTDIKDLINFTKDKRFYNPVGADKARVQTKIATMVGALRLPITGPGPLTDAEREFLIDTIGDPSKFFSLKQVQMAKLDEILKNMNRRVEGNFKNAGIDLASETAANQQDRLAAQGITPERQEQLKQFLQLKKRQSK